MIQALAFYLFAFIAVADFLNAFGFGGGGGGGGGSSSSAIAGGGFFALRGLNNPMAGVARARASAGTAASKSRGPFVTRARPFQQSCNPSLLLGILFSR